MRIAAGIIFAGTVSLLASSAAWSQTPPAAKSATSPAAQPAPQAAPAPAAAAAKQAPQPARAACTNPNALGVGRTVEIDTTGGPGFGFEHFKTLDFLRDKEVVLTFDDGPWPVNTPAVLKALAEECTTGIFFTIGKHATYYPEIIKQVYAAGHTIGTHTWSHVALVNKKLSEEQRKEEIEKGFSRGEMGARRRFTGTVLPLPGAAASAGNGHLSWRAQHCDVLDRSRLLRFQGEERADRDRQRDAQGRQARQGHHPDARLPQAHRRSRARTSEEAEGRRLQGGRDAGEGTGAGHRKV